MPSPPAHPKTTSNGPPIVARQPMLPYLIACLICLCIALGLGYGAWRIYAGRSAAAPGGKVKPTPGRTASPIPQATPMQEAPTPMPSQPPVETPPQSGTPGSLGELPVPAGTVILGDDGNGTPSHTISVEAFAIAETEVTNEQYAEFVKETGHRAAAGWKNGLFQPGAEREPVTGVTWQDAVDYCNWLGQKSGMTVRLPTEAEWTRAARGEQNDKYPWGAAWKEECAASHRRRPEPVKSHPAGMSPFFVYDMAGNVWEWVADDDSLKSSGARPLKGKVVKGGAASEDKDAISVVSRVVAPVETADAWIGFRYVVLRPSAAR